MTSKPAPRSALLTGLNDKTRRTAKLAGPAIRQRLTDIELATVSALRALQMDIDGDTGTPSETVIKRARAAMKVT